MSILESLQSRLEAQRAAFTRAVPSYSQRMQALAALRDGVRAKQADILHAISEDFGGRSCDETLMLEIFPLLDQIRHARSHLKSWMRRRRVRSSWFLQPSTAFYQYQPLGVAGVIGTWNYQVLLTLGPLVDALAAGNHVMLKPSEVAPRSAEIIAAIIRDAFSPEYVACITGGPETSSVFAGLPFDYLFFTGSARVGKLVMQAASANLTPLTLELGGKSPAILHASYPLRRALERILAAKLYSAGQTCVAPDYVLLPEGMEAEFLELARTTVAALYPTLLDNPDYTRIVNRNHYARLSTAIEDAVNKGARVVTLTPESDQGTCENRVFSPTLVFAVTNEMTLLQEEIFGPVLPVVTYRTLDEAIEFVNARPRPLALYYFDNEKDRINQVLQRTMSGGVTINDCIFHLAQHNLPFGGVGPSGMGHYHGFDGFVTFSNKRAVMVQNRWTATSLFRPPYGPRKRFIIEALLKLTVR